MKKTQLFAQLLPAFYPSASFAANKEPNYDLKMSRHNQHRKTPFHALFYPTELPYRMAQTGSFALPVFFLDSQKCEAPQKNVPYSNVPSKGEKEIAMSMPESTSTVMPTYGQLTTQIMKGEGPYVWDAAGRRYLDALTGIAVCGLGHCPPAVTKAITEQATTLMHCSNLYNSEPQQLLGNALIEVSGMEKVFFSNSGAEANEAAIKIARKFGNDQGITEPEIIVTEKSFHGRTMATLTATGNEKVKTGFTPVLSGFKHVAFNDIEAVKNAATSNTVAVMVEPVQGEGGVNVPNEGYLKALRDLCDENNWLLILDEIQTGNGRTGKYFAYQHEGILPDVCTTAKGLGNGVPIGACLAAKKATHVLQAGNHGSTFGGNPVACAAALAVNQELKDGTLIQRVAELGNTMLASLKEQLGNTNGVVDIRGKGLMIGIELNRPCGELVELAKEKSLLINVASGNTIRLLPPFILSDEQARTIVNTVSELVLDFLKTSE